MLQKGQPVTYRFSVHTSMEEPTTTALPWQSTLGVKEIIEMILATNLLLSAIMINLPVIVTLIKSPKVQLHGQGMLLSLVLSDLLFVMVSVPSALLVYAGGEILLSDTLCLMQGFLICWLSTTSVSNITVIGLARYWSIVHSAWFRGLKKYHLILLMLSAWVYAFFVILPSVTGWGQIVFSSRIGTCMMDWTFNSNYAVFLLVFSYLLPLVVISICYVRIFLVFWQSRAKFTQQTSNKCSESLSRKSDFRLAVQLLILLLTYTLCWGPFLIVSALIDRDGTMDRLVYDIVKPVLGMSCMLNPMIYFFFNPGMREEARQILCCCPRKNQCRVGPPVSVRTAVTGIN